MLQRQFADTFDREGKTVNECKVIVPNPLCLALPCGFFLLPTYSPIQWLMEALSVRLKRPGREADASPLSSAEVKNEWRCNSTKFTKLSS
jgi:hypothetical protein